MQLPGYFHRKDYIMKLSDIKNLTPQDLNKMNRAALAKLVSSSERIITRRLKSIEKADRFSWAGENYTKSRAGTYSVRGKNRNQLLSQAFNQISFFTSPSSTLEGIKKIERNQDMRLFGTTKSGRPRRTLDVSERREMWNLYSTFMEDTRYSKWGAILGYNELQKFFAEEVASGRSNKDNYFERVDDIFRRQYEDAKNDEYESSIGGTTNIGGNSY